MHQQTSAFSWPTVSPSEKEKKIKWTVWACSSEPTTHGLFVASQLRTLLFSTPFLLLGVLGCRHTPPFSWAKQCTFMRRLTFSLPLRCRRVYHVILQLPKSLSLPTFAPIYSILPISIFPKFHVKYFSLLSSHVPASSGFFRLTSVGGS